MSMRILTIIIVGEKRYKCNDCAVTFTQEGNLKVHQRIHTGLLSLFCILKGLKFE